MVNAKIDDTNNKGPPARKGKTAKENVLLSAVTEPFADDSTLYYPRISREARVEYWGNIISQGRTRSKRVLPAPPLQWVARDRLSLQDRDPNTIIFPKRKSMFLRIARSKKWDQLYLGKDFN